MKLKGFTIAVTNVDAMVRFYNAVFDADLQPIQAFGTVLYSGELAGFVLTFCPNSLLQIEAEKNRQQLSFLVDDLTLTLRQIIAHGGSQLGEIAENKEGNTCGVLDPDGNSIELTERKETST